MFLDHLEPARFLPLVTLLHAFPKLKTYLIPLGLEFESGYFCLALQSSVSYKSSIFMMLSLACSLLRDVVFHPSRSELTVVRLDAMV
jgi:hypothetical protein